MINFIKYNLQVPKNSTNKNYLNGYTLMKAVRGLGPFINLLINIGRIKSMGERKTLSKLIFSRDTPASTSFNLIAPSVARPIFEIINIEILFTFHTKRLLKKKITRIVKKTNISLAIGLTRNKVMIPL